MSQTQASEISRSTQEIQLREYLSQPRRSVDVNTNLSMDLWGPGKQPVFTGRDSASSALAGQLSAQGNLLRQGAQNLGEAQALLGAAGSGMERIGQTLSEIRGVLDEVGAGTMDSQQAADLITNMGSQLDSIIQSTRWQGIAPLDGTSWGRQPSIPTVGSGNGSSSVPLMLSDQSATFSSTNIRSLINLDSPEGVKKSSSLLSDMQKQAREISQSYNDQASGYANLSVALQSQADIMDTAVQKYASGLNIGTTPAGMATSPNGRIVQGTA